MKILIATHNPAKFKRYKTLLEPLGNLEIISLSDIDIIDKVDEPFNNAKDNAIHKAKFYSQKSGIITIAIDEAVNTNFLPNDEQPGVYVRRLKKENVEFTDRDVLTFWEETFSQYPQPDKKFTWDYSIAYRNPQDDQFGFSRVEVESVVIQPFSKKIVPGYPMSSFLSLSGTNKQHSELTEQEKAINDTKNFRKFVGDFSVWIKDLSQKTN